MEQLNEIKYYPPDEERINIISHAIGFALSIIALVLLFRHAFLHGTLRQVIAFGIFGVSLTILYGASTIYHSTKKPEYRKKMRIIDHASIFILIAGTYTPFTLITLKGSTGWILFAVSWGIAIVGIILKIFFTGKYKLISTLTYIFTGSIIVFVINPLVNNLSQEGLFWLFGGGIAYIIGAILYGIKKIKFNHAIFHFFVLIGSFCHFISVYFFV